MWVEQSLGGFSLPRQYLGESASEWGELWADVRSRRLAYQDDHFRFCWNLYPKKGNPAFQRCRQLCGGDTSAKDTDFPVDGHGLL